jgi:hypothetical protein
MTTGGRKKAAKRMRNFHYFDDAYLDSGLSKGEAERRAWKALSALMEEGSGRRGKF